MSIQDIENQTRERTRLRLNTVFGGSMYKSLSIERSLFQRITSRTNLCVAEEEGERKQSTGVGGIAGRMNDLSICIQYQQRFVLQMRSQDVRADARSERTSSLCTAVCHIDAHEGPNSDIQHAVILDG